MDGEWPIARISEAVRAQARQMDFPVGGDEPIRPHQRRGIEELPIRSGLDEAVHGPYSQPLTVLDHPRSARSRYRFGDGADVFA